MRIVVKNVEKLHKLEQTKETIYTGCIISRIHTVIKFPNLLIRLIKLTFFVSVLLLVANLSCRHESTSKKQTKTLVIIGEDVRIRGALTFKLNPETGEFDPDITKPGIVYLFRLSQTFAGVYAKAGDVYRVVERGKLQKFGEFDLKKSNEELAIEFGIRKEKSLEFTVQEKDGKPYDFKHSPVGGIWEGRTIGEAFWLLVRFEVDTSQNVVTKIYLQYGFKGDDHTLASWEPSNGIALIESDGFFKSEDNFGNFIKGRFGTRKYAIGTVNQQSFTDDKERTPPVQWRAAPVEKHSAVDGNLVKRH